MKFDLFTACVLAVLSAHTENMTAHALSLNNAREIAPLQDPT